MTYSPQIRVRIKTAQDTFDVSHDISTATVNRRRGVSSWALTLTNRGRKYDSRFSPMDRIAIYLKRIGPPLLVLSGYLDSVPVYSTHSQSVRLTGSCSLKRLQNWYWDPGSEAAVDLLTNLTFQDSDSPSANDGGISERIIKVLGEVMDWPREMVHIGAVPTDWFDTLADLGRDVVEEAEAAEMVSLIGNGSLAGESMRGLSTIPGDGPGTGTIPRQVVTVSTFGGSRGSGNMDLTQEPIRLADSARGQWGGPFYVAGPWGYRNPDGTSASGVTVATAKTWWRNRSILLSNPRTGVSVVARAAHWVGNSSATDVQVSSQTYEALGLKAGERAYMSFPHDPDTKQYGPRSGSSTVAPSGAVDAVRNNDIGGFIKNMVRDAADQMKGLAAPGQTRIGATFSALEDFLRWCVANGITPTEHPCVPLSSKILTQRGLLSHDEVQVGDYTVGWNPKTDKSEWTRVVDVLHFDDAEVLSVENQRWGFQSTANHRWLSEAVQHGGREPRRRWLRSLDKIGNEHKIITSVDDGVSGTLDVSPEEAALLAWIWGDGSIKTSPWMQVSVYQSKPEGIATFTEQVLDKMDPSHIWEQGDGRLIGHGGRLGRTTRTWTVSAPYARDLLSRAGLVDKHDGEGTLVRFITGLSPEARQAWLEGMIGAEGHMTGTNLNRAVISQNAGPLLTAITVAAQLCGYNPRVSTRKGKRSNENAVSLCKPVHQRKRMKVTHTTREPVWCVATELGTWTMQQGSRLSLTGNSYGGVTPGYHLKPEQGGYHWWPPPNGGGAADLVVSGGGQRMERLLDMAALEAARRNLGVIWRAPNHWTHMHVSVQAHRDIGRLVYESDSALRALPPPQALDGSPGDVGTGGGGGGGGSGIDPGAMGEALFQTFEFIQDFRTTEAGQLLGGRRALMNDTPLYGTIDRLFSVGLRDWCSAPNGDIIGWFPDYFGRFGTAGKMIVEPIEVMAEGFDIHWSDERLKTHAFVTSSQADVGGNLLANPGLGTASGYTQMSMTAGIASVEFPGMMRALFGIDGPMYSDGAKGFLERFGARPDWEAMDIISGPRAEFFFSTYRFMKNWSQQFTATVRMTFMPELYPGMVVAFPHWGVQAYVEAVSHNINMTSGFTTSASLTAWSQIAGEPVKIPGLPIGGEL